MVIQIQKPQQQTAENPEEIVQGDSYDPMLPPETEPWSHWLALASFVIAVLSLVINLGLTIGVYRFANRPLPHLVQLEDGKTMAVGAIDPLYRKPEVIKNFTSEILYLLYSWSNQIQVTDESGEKRLETDEGVVVSQSHLDLRVTTPASEAASALSSDLRTSFLEGLAQLIQQAGGKKLWTGSLQSAVEFIDVGEPELQEAGKWKVLVTANLQVKEVSGRAMTIRTIPLNSEVYVRAIDTPPLPLPASANEYQKAVYSIRQSQLEIYLIVSTDEASFIR